jgi:hypothetical protein
MPLDRQNGEPGDLGPGFVIAKTAKWTETPFFGQACEMAAKAFGSAGAMRPIRFYQDDVLVQEYPQLNKLEFVFLRDVAGKEMFYRYRFDLPEPLVAELVTAGRWERSH